MITYDKNFDAEEASASQTFVLRSNEEMKRRRRRRMQDQMMNSHGLQSCTSKPAREKKTLHFQGWRGVLLVPPDVSNAETWMQHLRGPPRGCLLNPGRLWGEPDLIQSRCSPRRTPLASYLGFSMFWLLGNKFWRQKSSPSRKDRSKVTGGICCFFLGFWGGETFVWELRPGIFWTDVHKCVVGKNWSIGSEMFLFPKERPGKEVEFQGKT